MMAALGITCHNLESAAFANSGGDAHAPIHGPLKYALETDCLAGHIGFEPANPSASYLIGIS